MIADSLKARDLGRGPRLAIHSPTADPPEADPGSWSGEAKLAGRAVGLARDDAAGQPHFFSVDITEVVITRVGTPPDHLKSFA